MEASETHCKQLWSGGKQTWADAGHLLVPGWPSVSSCGGRTQENTGVHFIRVLVP